MKRKKINSKELSKNEFQQVPLKFISKETIAQALIQNNGLLYQTATFLNTTRLKLSNFINKNPDLLNILNNITEINLDIAENELFKQIQNGKFNAIKYYLDHQGQKRGYKIKPEQETNIQNGIVIIPSTQDSIQWAQKAINYKQQQKKELDSVPELNDSKTIVE